MNAHCIRSYIKYAVILFDKSFHTENLKGYKCFRAYKHVEMQPLGYRVTHDFYPYLNIDIV